MLFNLHNKNVGTKIPSKIINPPIVGTPSFCFSPFNPNFLTFSPTDFFCKKVIIDFPKYVVIINEKITEKKRCYVTSYGTEDWADNLINQERFIDEKYNLENLFEYWKTKVFKKKDWGMRKLLKELPFKLTYETLDKQLLDPSFNQVR